MSSEPSREQARRDRDAGRARADDHDVVLRVDGRCALRRAACEPRRDGREIVAGLGGRRDDLVDRTRAGLRQRPQRRRAHAAAAVRQHRAGERRDQHAELRGLLVGDLARVDRQVVHGDAERRGGGADLGDGRLVRAFAVRPVADDRAHTGRLQRGRSVAAICGATDSVSVSLRMFMSGVSGRAAARLQIVRRVERDLQVAHAVVFGRRQVAGAHVDLHRRQDQHRHVERGVARGAHGDELVLADAVAHVDVAWRCSATVVTNCTSRPPGW
jgi:hypothetical protein